MPEYKKIPYNNETLTIVTFSEEEQEEVGPGLFRTEFDLSKIKTKFFQIGFAREGKLIRPRLVNNALTSNNPSNPDGKSL